MSVWKYLSGVRWDILQALTDNDTMTAISDEAETSVPNVSKHLQLLEAQSYVKKEQVHDGTPGKPANSYDVASARGFTGVISKDCVQRQQTTLNSPVETALWKAITLTDPPHLYAVLQYLTNGVLADSDAIALVDHNAPEFFAVANDVETFRDAYSNVTITDPGGVSCEIVCWAHTKDEVREGLQREDDYYIRLVNDRTVLYDPNECMRWNV